MASHQFQAIRGMNDLLPSDLPLWHWLESVCRRVVSQYAYQEIRFPVLEKTALFKRTVGEVTDIVEKEMYTFEDRNGDSLSLRPEGTAACVRAALQGGLLHNAVSRLWYMGPMYRHERPQKGRYRQFHQFGVESFGVSGVRMEVEQLLLTHRLFHELGLLENVSLKINSLGSAACRSEYQTALVAFLRQHEASLDEDSKRRLLTNPLRILDSKNPDVQALLVDAPSLQDYWSDDSRAHFDELCTLLKIVGIDFIVDNTLVRGLDYYCHTVYEWVTDDLGAQGTVCAGGRYDGLVEMLGGKSTPAVGFSIGLERLVLLLQTKKNLSYCADAYCVLVGEAAEHQGMSVAESIRNACPNLNLEVNVKGGSFKSQLKRADKSGAAYALIIGDDELNTGKVTVKNLRHNQEQQHLTLEEVVVLLQEIS